MPENQVFGRAVGGVGVVGGVGSALVPNGSLCKCVDYRNALSLYLAISSRYFCPNLLIVVPFLAR